MQLAFVRSKKPRRASVCPPHRTSVHCTDPLNSLRQIQTTAQLSIDALPPFTCEEPSLEPVSLHGDCGSVVFRRSLIPSQKLRLSPLTMNNYGQHPIDISRYLDDV